MSKENKTSKKALGRPSIAIPDKILEEILDGVSTTTKGLEILCEENPSWPSARTIYRRMRHDEDFCQKYARAKIVQATILADEIITISDYSDRDTIVDEDGIERANHEWIARSRLRVDSRKWLVSKLIPKVYGDKTQTETTITFNHENALNELK
jgi:hypothetical protein